MPHLSPMKWKLMALMVLTTIATISSSTWWSQTPNFPDLKPQPLNKPFTFSSWPWN